MGPNAAQPEGGTPERESGAGNVVRLPSLASIVKNGAACSHADGPERQLETLNVVHNRFSSCISQLSRASELLVRSTSSKSVVNESDLLEAKFSLLLAEDRLSFALTHLKNCEVFASTQHDIERIDSLIKSHRTGVEALRVACSELLPEEFSQMSANILGEAQRIRFTATCLAPHRDKVRDAIDAKELELYPRESA